MSVWLPRSNAIVWRSGIIRRSVLDVQRARPFAPAVLRSFPRHIHSSRPVLAPPDASSESNPAPPVPKEAPKASLPSRVWKKVKHEASHYWSGTKLLVSEIRISARLQRKILHGETLTRRERRQVCNSATYASSAWLMILRMPP
jgi:LETM1 and EF-hand domain-containing protein 1, mitochondrial